MFLQVPAFQAGCRGFEPRLPLYAFAGRPTLRGVFLLSAFLFFSLHLGDTDLLQGPPVLKLIRMGVACLMPLRCGMLCSGMAVLSGDVRERGEGERDFVFS